MGSVGNPVHVFDPVVEQCPIALQVQRRSRVQRATPAEYEQEIGGWAAYRDVRLGVRAFQDRPVIRQRLVGAVSRVSDIGAE